MFVSKTLCACMHVQQLSNRGAESLTETYFFNQVKAAPRTHHQHNNEARQCTVPGCPLCQDCEAC